MKKYFLVYDDETIWFVKNRKNLLESVEKFSDFELIVFKKNEIDKEFKEKNKHIFQIKFGDGAWLWKPYIINKTLEQINKGDLLFYMDASYEFVEPFEDLYKNLIEEQDLIVWKNKPNENVYPMWKFCNKHILEKYNILENIYDKDDIKEPWAGAILVKKTPFSVSLIKEWLDMCQIKEDIWGKEGTSEEYRTQHRNDQALLGILLYKYNIKMENMPKKYLQNKRHPW